LVSESRYESNIRNETNPKQIKNALPFSGKSKASFDCTSASTFQLVVAYFDWISQADSMTEIFATAITLAEDIMKQQLNLLPDRAIESSLASTNKSTMLDHEGADEQYIVESISVGARFAPTIFRVFKFIVALTYFADFQLVVEFDVIPHSEGECNASIIFGDKATPLKSDGAQSAPNSIFNNNSKFIAVSSFPTNFSDTFTKLIVTSMFGRSNQSLLNDDFHLVVKLIPILTSEGARAPSSKLIVGCVYSEISFHFCEDCRILREGVKDSTIGSISNNGIVGRINHNGLVGRIVQNGLIIDHNGLVGRNDLIDHIGLDLFGHNGLYGVIGLGVSLIGVGLVSFIGLSISFIGLGIIGFVGLSLVSLGGLIGHFSFVGRCIIGLIESSASSNHWPIGLIGIIGLGLIASSASMASLARRLISFVGLVGLSTHRLFRDLTAAVKATKISWQLKQAAALGVAMMWWWLALAGKKLCWCWLASFGDSLQR